MTSINTFAQNKSVLVKFSPLALIDDVSFPTIQGAIELNVAKNISWHNEVGVKYRKPFSENPDTNFIASRGFKAKTEVRYYFSKTPGSGFSTGLEGYYVAVNVFYLKDDHNTDTRYYYQLDSSTIKIDNFGVKKFVIGTNFLIGRQYSFGKRFLIDIYSGIGARYRNITSVNKEFNYERDGLFQPQDVTVEGFKYIAESKGGESVLPNLTLGFRIGYRL